jgi:hypothetical protein
MAQRTYYYNKAYKSDPSYLEGQTASIRLNAQVDVYQYSTVPQKFLSVNLQGSFVSAGNKLINNRDDKRGYFTEFVDVTIGLYHCDDQNQTWDWVVEQGSPSTTMGSTATSSSTGLSVNESAGTFGPIPTIGIGAGISIGSTFTKNLSDFKVINRSTNDSAIHRYPLAASKDGTPYAQAIDLVDMSAKGQFSGATLFHLPDLAVANLPLISQVIFMINNTKAADPELTIHVSHHLMQVEKTYKFFTVDRDTTPKSWSEEFQQTVSLSTTP